MVPPVVIFAVKTGRHYPYIYTLIRQVVAAAYQVRIVGPIKKTTEVKLFENLQRRLKSEIAGNIQLEFIPFRPRTTRHARMQEFFEYVAARKFNHGMTASELSRILPEWLRPEVSKSVSKVRIPFLKLLVSLLSIFPRRILVACVNLIDGLRGARELVDSTLNAVRPVVVIATPGNMRRCTERIWLKAANERRIKTAIVVLSWDNPTSKGPFLECPTVTFAQSQAQVSQLKATHGSEVDIQLVGSCQMELFLEESRKSNSVRARNVKRPYILFLGSSVRAGTNQEHYLTSLLRLWHSLPVKNLDLVIRSHPANPISDEISSLIRKQRRIKLASGSIGLESTDNANLHNQILGATAVMAEATSASLQAHMVGAPTYILNFAKSGCGERHVQQLLESKELPILTSLSQLSETLQILNRDTLSMNHPSEKTAVNSIGAVMGASTRTSNDIAKYLRLY